MTIEQLDKIDFISTDRNGDINLSISDHLEWDDKNEHIYMLQEKINKYLSFIESDEIIEHVKDLKGKPIIISVVCKHKPNVAALEFLEKAKQTTSVPTLNRINSIGYPCCPRWFCNRIS